MLNKEKHQLYMGQILKDIYTDISIASLLGFKGGTCSYFFYGLTRFSVDLDFDLLDVREEYHTRVFERMQEIVRAYGTLKDCYIKKNTIFLLLSYGEEDHNIKIEISTRNQPFSFRDMYELTEYLGISMLVAKKEYLFAGKLAALTLRTDVAMRDVYDINFFAKNHWDIAQGVVEALTKNTLKEQLTNCIAVIENIKDNEVLRGLGELLDEKEKAWVRGVLRGEVIFLLKNYISIMK